ncbi:hypothetical protein [Nocardia jejuensis]|uniref:hypothetical protein n=1 Tax=Nocardia jejuensis TaxID=328049 RepID=UPI0008308FB8|nr:hypothetical protein [Nocardia jejuensis]
MNTYQTAGLLLAGGGGHAMVVRGLWLRFTSTTLELTRHRRHIADLLRALPEGSEVESSIDSGALYTKVTIAAVTTPQNRGRRGR